MINISQDILPKEFSKFCTDCRHSKKPKICDKCLIHPRERPFWELKETEGIKQQVIKQTIKQVIKQEPKFKRRKLKGFDL